MEKSTLHTGHQVPGREEQTRHLFCDVFSIKCHPSVLSFSATAHPQCFGILLLQETNPWLWSKGRIHGHLKLPTRHHSMKHTLLPFLLKEVAVSVHPIV